MKPDEPKAFEVCEAHELPAPVTCPYCRYADNGFVSGITGEAKPRKGNIAICGRCGAPAIFRADLSLRAPTNADLARWQADPELWARLVIAFNVIRRHPRYGGLN